MCFTYDIKYVQQSQYALANQMRQFLVSISLFSPFFPNLVLGFLLQTQPPYILRPKWKSSNCLWFHLTIETFASRPFPHKEWNDD